MKAESRPIGLKNIRITDSFFGNYANRVADVMIPYQWKMLNEEGKGQASCLKNFRIAAGEIQGKREGVVFLDTDLYKWLEALAYCLDAGYGKKHRAIAEKAIDLVSRAQEDDGYLNTYYSVNASEKKWTNLVEGHELYTCGHLYEAASAYYSATGNKKILDIACRNADHVCRVFGKGENQIAGYPGHPEIEIGLIKLYRVTGIKRYLNQAKYFVCERGTKPNYLSEEIRKRGGYEFFPEFGEFDEKYFLADEQPIKQKKAEGHAVRAMYLFSAMADLSKEYNDKEMLKSCKRLWDDVVQKRMYVTGSIGSSGLGECFTTDYDLPNKTNYSETCASIGLMMFGQRMACVTGSAEYYDTVELALYNTLLASISKEGNRYFYVNPLEVVPEFCTDHTYMKHVKPVRQKWFGVACCPPNAARTFASLGQYIFSADTAGSLYINQFISSELRYEASGKSYELKMDSDFLRTGRITIACTAGGNGKICIRVPGYAEGYSLTLNGKKTEAAVRKGYLSVKPVNGKNIIELNYDIKAHWLAADDRVREDAGKAVLKKGPLVYCLEEADNGKMLSEIYVMADSPVRETTPIPDLPGDIPSLLFDGVRYKNEITDGKLYDRLRIKKGSMEKCTAIPYGLWQNRGKGEMTVWQKVLLK